MKKKRPGIALLLLVLALVLPLALSGCKTLARAEGTSGGLQSWGVGVRF